MKVFSLKFMSLIVTVSASACLPARPALPTFSKGSHGDPEQKTADGPNSTTPGIPNAGTPNPSNPNSGDGTAGEGQVPAPMPAPMPAPGSVGPSPSGPGPVPMPGPIPTNPTPTPMPTNPTPVPMPMPGNQTAKLSLVFIGGSSAKIDVYKLDRTTGSTTLLKSNATPGKTPTFLSIDKKNKRVFAVNEQSDGGLMSFSLDTATGVLNPLSSAAMPGGATHVSIDPSARFAFGASYGSGHVASFPIGSDGKLGAPVADVVAGMNAHQVVATSTALFVPCLGSNYIQMYAKGADGSLTPNGRLGVGGGPRHLAMYPSGKWAYILTELNQTVQALKLNASGKFENNAYPVSAQVTPILGTGAEIQVHPNGKYVYASLRGADAIATFAVQTDGTILLLENVKTGGVKPRHFSVEPQGNFIFAANQESGGVTTLKIDPNTGKLSKVPGNIPFEFPQFVEVVDFD